MGLSYEDIIEARHAARADGRDVDRVVATEADIESLIDDGNMIEIEDVDLDLEYSDSIGRVNGLEICEDVRTALITTDGREYEI